jgi:hypothetical protein
LVAAVIITNPLKASRVTVSDTATAIDTTTAIDSETATAIDIAIDSETATATWGFMRKP